MARLPIAIPYNRAETPRARCDSSHRASQLFVSKRSCSRGGKFLTCPCLWNPFHKLKTYGHGSIISAKSIGSCSATGGVVPGGLGTRMPPGGLATVRSVSTHVAAGRIH